MPSNLIKCDSCHFRYAPNHYRRSPSCILCQLQRKLDESERRYEQLARKFSVLEDFVASNVGCSPETGVTYAAKAAATPAAPPCSPDQEATPFTEVKNGGRPKTKSFLPISTYNSFAVLAVEEEEVHEARLIGDSIVRNQLEEFCGRARATRKRLCMPGGCLDDITAACQEATAESNNNTLFIVHAGTNDVQRTRSEELLEKYKKLIRTFKTKTNNNNLIISGILPRIKATDRFYDKAFSTNNRLKTLCFQEGVDYINMWDDFYDKPELFLGDGLHLSAIGAARFGRLISDKVSLFRQKNEARPPLDASS